MMGGECSQFSNSPMKVEEARCLWAEAKNEGQEKSFFVPFHAIDDFLKNVDYSPKRNTATSAGHPRHPVGRMSLLIKTYDCPPFLRPPNVGLRWTP